VNISLQPKECVFRGFGSGLWSWKGKDCGGWWVVVVVVVVKLLLLEAVVVRYSTVERVVVVC